MIQDPDDGAMRAMVSQSCFAKMALLASAIDFTDDSCSRKRTIFCDSNKLVAWDTLKVHVASQQLQIGFANPSLYHLDACVADFGFCGLIVISELET
jgi:hypothetical protein